MAKSDSWFKRTYWMGIVLIFLASKASSQNTTENFATELPSTASPSGSIIGQSTIGNSENTTTISNGEVTSSILPTTSFSLQSVLSTMESSSLSLSREMSTTIIMIPLTTTPITPNESNIYDSVFTDLANTTNDMKTPVSSEMTSSSFPKNSLVSIELTGLSFHTSTPISSEITSPSFQVSTSSVRYSNPDPIQPTVTISSYSSMHPVSSELTGAISSVVATPTITTQISTGASPPNASVTTDSTFQTPDISTTLDEGTVTRGFGDLTAQPMTTKVSEYSEFTSTMTSEDTGYSTPKPSTVVSSDLQDSSTADIISQTMKTTLSPSMTSYISSAGILSSVQHPFSVMESESFSTSSGKTVNTIDHTTLRTVLQPSKTAEQTMISSATVTLHDTVAIERLTRELGRLQDNIDDLEGEINGWKIGVAILASFLGLILLAVIIRCILRWRQRDQPANMTGGGVDDITRREVLDRNKTFFRRPLSSDIVEKRLNGINSLFGKKRSSGSHELETFGGVHPAGSSVMEEVNETEIAGGGTADVQITQFRFKDGEDYRQPKINGDSREIRNSFTEVDLQ